MGWFARALGGAAVVVGLAVAAGAAHAEIVTRGADDGMLALGPRGIPVAAYVRGTHLVIASRAAPGRWRAATAATVAPGSSVMAFVVGRKGPVALVQSANDKTLALVRRRGGGWQRIALAGGLAADAFLGWPGLALDAAGLPAAAYTRWNSRTHNSQLFLTRVDARGRARTQRITTNGFPQSVVPPPAAPVLVGTRVHVVETYGYGLVGTIEWYPERHTWTGLFLDAVQADYPLGPVLARSRTGTLYATWTMSMFSLGAVPITLGVRDRSTAADFVLDRGVPTALALPASGPEIAANELLAGDQLDLTREGHVWAGAVVRGRTRVELDGWLAGYAVAPGGGRDLLLAEPDGLTWFRSRDALTRQVGVQATIGQDGRATVSGSVRGVRSGQVLVYREQAGAARQLAGRAALGSDGSFSLVDPAPIRPFLYRAVYIDPRSGIPFAGFAQERAPDEEQALLPRLGLRGLNVGSSGGY